MNHSDRPGFGRAFLATGIVLVGIAAISKFGTETYSTSRTITAHETYRLVHAIGNDEKIAAKGLTKADCEAMKKDNIAVAEALGVHSQSLGIGSITCLPDSSF